jgi:hypothetical protein
MEKSRLPVRLSSVNGRNSSPETAQAEGGYYMTVMAEKKFAVDVVYNGVTKPIEVQPEEQVTALLHKAISSFGVTQNAHLLSLYRQDGSLVPEAESVERAGLTP